MPGVDQDLRGVLLPNGSAPIYDFLNPLGDRLDPVVPQILTLTGSGFGDQGPNIVLFDRFLNGTPGQLIPPTKSGDIGAWKKTAWQQPRYYQYDGRIWMAGRNTTDLNAEPANIAGLMFSVNEYFTEFCYAHRLRVPDGMNFPGAAEPGVLPGNSTFKMSWFSNIDANGDFTGSDEQDQTIHDLCIPTYVGSNSFAIAGNTTAPKQYNSNPTTGNSLYMGYSHNQENLYCYYQSGAESIPGAKDARTEGAWFRGDVSVSQFSYSQCNPFNVQTGVQLNTGYRAFRTAGWFGSAAGFSNVLPLFSDIYLAIGPTSRAKVWVTNSPVFSASTKGYLLPVHSWSANSIAVDIVEHEKLGYYHVQPIVGPLIENVTGVINNG